MVATPYTPATDKIMSRAAIEAMKPTAVVVNVGRGKCMDEAALIEALRDGKIRGAALDVFETEPLPAMSPLWDLENVIMTPHNADRTAIFQARGWSRRPELRRYPAIFSRADADREPRVLCWQHEALHRRRAAEECLRQEGGVLAQLPFNNKLCIDRVVLHYSPGITSTSEPPAGGGTLRRH